MVKKFQLRLIDPTGWRLLVKSTVLSAALLTLIKMDFSIGSFLFFLAAVLYIYFSELPEIGSVKTSYLVLIASTIIGFRVASVASDTILYVSFLFSLVLFWILLRLVNFHFKDRFHMYGIFNTALLIQAFLLFFYFAKPAQFVFPGLVIVLSLVPLFAEVFVFFGEPRGKKVFVASSVLVLIFLELSFLVTFLPMGFISSAAFVVLLTLIARDALIFHFSGRLNLDFIFRELAFFVVVAFVILASSSWGI